MSVDKKERLLSHPDIDACLITSTANMRYIAGFTGEGYVYVSKNTSLVVTDSRYTIATKAECEGYEVKEWGRGVGYYEPLMRCLILDGVTSLGVEDQVMTLCEYHRLSDECSGAGLADIALTEIGSYGDDLRQIKTTDEIEKIKIAESIGDEAYAKLLPHLAVGMTEREVAARLEYYMKVAGADGTSFDTIAASGEHSAMPHAVPTDRTLREGDLLTMDFGCTYQGYCSDMTRTVVIGPADDRQRHIYKTVLTAQEQAIRSIRPGMTGREVDAIARDVIEEEGYGDCFGHSLGHSVGLMIHEGPSFSPREETVIRPGMVITVEPGIYIDGYGGVRIEDVVVVTEDGCENITHSDKHMTEIGV